jgi:hypothetical protein
MLLHIMSDAYKSIILSFAIGLMLSITAYGQAVTSVYEIVQSPGTYINENVQVEGLVFQYVPGTSNTVAYYLIRDDNGAEVQVNTVMEPPETNIKYRVTGVLYHENRNLFISELSRQSLAVPAESHVIVEADNTVLYYALFGLGFVLLLSLYLLYSNRSGNNSSEKSDVVFSTPSRENVSTQQEAIAAIKNDAYDIFVNSSAENTIKVDRDYMTMKALPGKLVVLNGQQAEKTLSLFGATTEEGQVITIGRESPDWKSHLKSGRENAHIRIQDSTKTLSRMQAELIYNNGNMKLRNIGQANPTIVDDVVLKVGETVQLNDGSIIQAGNLKMRFEM